VEELLRDEDRARVAKATWRSVEIVRHAPTNGTITNHEEAILRRTEDEPSQPRKSANLEVLRLDVNSFKEENRKISSRTQLGRLHNSGAVERKLQHLNTLDIAAIAARRRKDPLPSRGR